MSIPIIDTLESLGNFPVVNASDVQLDNERLPAVINGKVDKETGKQLSTNDYTNLDKNKLSGIEANANNYIHPTTSGNKHIPSGGSSGKILRWASDGTAQWDNETQYNDATTSAHGFMSAEDKAKLDGIAAGATAVTVDSDLSLSSENPVQNKIVTGALNNKADLSSLSALASRISECESAITMQAKTYNITDDMSQSDIQEILSSDEPKILYFVSDEYTFDNVFRVQSNTIIDLCGHKLIFTVSHGFFNFKGDDEFLEYNGNGNIIIRNGNIDGGVISFCHAKNIAFDNLVFRNILGNHVIEIAACCNFRVTNCDFGGTRQDSSASKNEAECIQIDYMNYESFPWFDDEDNPTYDITRCKNLEVAFCKFKAVAPSALYRGIGSHQYDTNTLNENALIHDNYFDSPVDAGISVVDYDGCYIYNNVFKYTTYPNDYDDKSGLITLCDLCYNINIYDNSFDGGVVAIRGLYPVRSSMSVSIHDNYFANFLYGSGEPYGQILKDVGILLLPNGSAISVKNNIFKNFNRRCIGGADNVGSQRTKLMTVISGNTFEYSQNNITHTISVFSENMVITENNFVIARNVTPTFIENFRCYVQHDGNYTCKNNFDKYFSRQNIKVSVDASADLSGNKDCTVRLLNQVTHSGSYTLSRNYNEFNTLVVIVGGATDTNVITLHSYDFPNALDARDYRFVVYSNEGNICTGIITLYDNNKIDIEISSSEIEFQRCYGMNV